MLTCLLANSNAPLSRGDLMITIVSMCMVMHPAKTVIKIMCRYNKCYGGNEQPGFVVNKKQFQDQ